MARVSDVAEATPTAPSFAFEADRTAVTQERVTSGFRNIRRNQTRDAIVGYQPPELLLGILAFLV